MVKSGSEPIAVRLPADVLAEVNEIAAAADRSRSWVILRALRLYLASEGGEVLSVARSRKAAGSGDHEDLDEVIADIERIVADGHPQAA
jgi:predicted transcriptional regulator